MGMNFDPTCLLLKPNMSWLWKDKKTDQLKSVLTKAEEEDKYSTVEKLTNIRKECLEFKKHLDKTFDKASAINTANLKGRKHLLDRLEENVQEVQNKIGSVRQWNFHQLTLLEYRERNLESWLMDFMEKKEELKDKAREKSEAISKLYEELTCELQGGRNPTQMVHMQAAVGPPTTSSSSTSSGLSPPSSSASRSQVGGGGPTTSSNGGSNLPKPTLTGWSTDDERIFDREAAKINLKWSAKRNKSSSANNATKAAVESQARDTVPAHDWWHKSEKLKFEFVRRVWTCTSGSVNTIEAVERYAKEWVKNEDLKCKKRIKVQKWRDQIAKEKEEERQKKELELKENVHDCKDCERKVKHLEKSKESKRKLAEWKEIKSMKEELEKADDLVKAVQELERNIIQQNKKAKMLPKRPKSAKNLFMSNNNKWINGGEKSAKSTPTNNSTSNSKVDKVHQKKMIQEYQKRDQEEVERRLHAARMKLEKAKSSLDLRNPIKHNPDEESTVRKPTFSSMSKMQNYDEPLTTFASTHELEQRLVQIENVPKLGLPSWRTPMGR